MLDIMENVQGIDHEWTTMHCGTSPCGPCDETTGIGWQRARTAPRQAGFHTYATDTVTLVRIRTFLGT